jgi:glycosyltransferase involved in cell wall biosynthesis
VYQRACRLAAQGKLKQAQALYEDLNQKSSNPGQRALITNDLAALDAVEGELDQARQGFEKALTLDPSCEPARKNLATLEPDLLVPQTQPALVPRPGLPPEPSPAEYPIKVAILSLLFNWPSTGGGNVHTYELAWFLAQAGFDVRHIYAHNESWSVGKVEGELPYASERLSFDDASWTPENVKLGFRQAVDTLAPDYVIITDSWNFKPHLADAVRDYPYILRFQAMECLCPLNNVRLLPEAGGRFGQCPLHQLANGKECAECLRTNGHRSGSLHQAEREFSGVGSAAYHELLLRSLKNAEAVLVVNPLMEAMISPYCRRVHVVTAGIDPGRFLTSQESRKDNSDKVILLFAGIVDEWMKGFHVLHEACARLWQRRRDFELVATNDPPGRLDEFTRFVGWLSQDKLSTQLREADILIMPTIAQEALGRTAVEAMAAGRPVIASRIGGLPFTVAEGATGLLCEPGNPEDLARKIEMLLDDPELRRRMGEAGRRRFDEHYAWPVIIERHYQSLLTTRRTAPAVVRGYRPVIPDYVDYGLLLSGPTCIRPECT